MSIEKKEALKIMLGRMQNGEIREFQKSLSDSFEIHRIHEKFYVWEYNMGATPINCGSDLYAEGVVDGIFDGWL
jgi:hypothetical protein